MLIRQIIESDLSALSALMDRYTLKPEQIKQPQEVARMQKQGFLLGEYSLDKMRQDLNKIFLVAEEQGKVIGYTRIDEQIDPEFRKFDEQGLVDWDNDTYKQKFYESQHYVVGGLLVAKEFGRRGIASAFLQKVCELLKQRKAKRLFAFIVTSPVPNVPSIQFHLKNGFVEIARLKSTPLLGFEQYRSSLFMKECVS